MTGREVRWSIGGGLSQIRRGEKEIERAGVLNLAVRGVRGGII